MTLLIGALAFIIALSLTPLVRQLALHIGMVDKPNARKVHLEPMPLLGGLAILLTTIVVAFIFIDERLKLIIILLPATLLALVGFLDDRGLLHHQVKLMMAMPLAALWLIFNGVHLNLFAPLGVPLGNWVDYVISFFWIVGITAAFSILDHMDGLCSGVAASACAAFAIIAFLNAQLWLAFLAITLSGSAMGFLRWNFKPAKLFMGDGGAMFLGFMCASLGLSLQLTNVPLETRWLIPIFVLVVPIFDTTLVTLSRSRRKLLPFSTPGKDHTAHRLANQVGQVRAVLTMYALSLVGGVIANLIPQLAIWSAYSIAVILSFMALGAIIWLENLPYDKQPQKTAGH